MGAGELASPAPSRTACCCRADIVGEDLVRAMSATPAEEYVLVEGDGTILGVLATADVDRAFEEGARK